MRTYLQSMCPRSHHTAQRTFSLLAAPWIVFPHQTHLPVHKDGCDVPALPHPPPHAVRFPDNTELQQASSSGPGPTGHRPARCRQAWTGRTTSGGLPAPDPRSHICNYQLQREHHRLPPPAHTRLEARFWTGAPPRQQQRRSFQGKMRNASRVQGSCSSAL